MDKKLSRVPTGIIGLDEMIEGGFPFPSTILVAGTAGAGKTIFSTQFLCEGARNNESCVFFSTMSESTQWMLRFLNNFKFIDRSYFGDAIKFVDMGPMLADETAPLKVLYFIEQQIEEYMPQRIVVDPLTIIEDSLGDKYRHFLYNLTLRLKNWQTTTLLTGEVKAQEPYPREVSYIVDGIILLTNVKIQQGERRRYLEVLKMRGTKHLTGDHLFIISNGGIQISPGLK
jgi:circadian clock protein KaiC